MQVFGGLLRDLEGLEIPPKVPPRNSTAPTRWWRRCDQCERMNRPYFTFAVVFESRIECFP